MSYCNSADVPVPGHRLRVRVGERALAARTSATASMAPLVGCRQDLHARVWVDGAGLFRSSS